MKGKNQGIGHNIRRAAARAACGLVLAAALVCGSCVAAFAAEAGTPNLDLGREGSISVTFRYDGVAVTDGALTIYRVADMVLDDGNEAYVYTDAYADCGYSLEDVTVAQLAADLAAYTQEQGIAGTEAEIGTDGTVTFADLSAGLYLVMQTTDSTGYYTIDSFLVTLPQDENGEWVSDVDASPKVEVQPKPEEPGTEGTENGTEPGTEGTEGSTETGKEDAKGGPEPDPDYAENETEPSTEDTE